MRTREPIGAAWFLDNVCARASRGLAGKLSWRMRGTSVWFVHAAGRRTRAWSMSLNSCAAMLWYAKAPRPDVVASWVACLANRRAAL